MQCNKSGIIKAVIAVMCILVTALITINFLGNTDQNIEEHSRQESTDELGLMTSLPIYWNEGDPFAQIAKGDAQLPWVRTAIEQKYHIRPVDLLFSDIQSEANGNASPLEGLERLAIIQPRGLSPSDNVALDDWVRAGGRLLYVIDPMLSGEYDVPISDPRHPPVIGLVPPVFARWGLELFYDDAQSDAPFIARWNDVELVAHLPGQLSLSQQNEFVDDSVCLIGAEGLIANCAVGEGQVTIMADAALFEPREGNDAANKAIVALLQRAFS